MVQRNVYSPQRSVSVVGKYLQINKTIHRKWATDRSLQLTGKKFKYLKHMISCTTSFKIIEMKFLKIIIF